jgi:hypothetical protein
MYNYETEKSKIFTDEGQRLFLAIRDKVKTLLNNSGAARMQEIISGNCGNSWLMLACVDRLVELNEIKEISQNTAGQYRVFIAL